MLLTSMCLSFASVRDFAFFFSAADASALGAADIGLRPRDGGPRATAIMPTPNFKHAAARVTAQPATYTRLRVQAPKCR